MNNYKKIKRMSLDQMAGFISGLLTDCTRCPQKKANCNKSSDHLVTIRCWLSEEAKNDGAGKD